MSAQESVHVMADAAELARAAADRVLEQARGALAARGSFHLALSGGSTPRGAYRELASRTDADFTRCHVWFSDERCVPPEHPGSNYRMARESGLLARLAPENVHRMRGEDPPAAEAQRYENELCTVLGVPPRLDLVLLGLGADGHVASLFPGTPALEQEGWVTVGRAPTEPAERLTLTFAALEQARAILFLVAGAEKRAVLEKVLPSGSGEVLPARRVRSRDGTVLWLVERSAAGGATAGGRGRSPSP